jgi:Zn-dependent protease
MWGPAKKPSFIEEAGWRKPCLLSFDREFSPRHKNVSPPDRENGYDIRGDVKAFSQKRIKVILMSMESSWPVPFVLDPSTLSIDSATAFCVSVLVAITLNAEAQAFMSNFLGDRRTGARDRLHFNAFLHLDILGSICYLVGGFGWPRAFDIDASKFEYPRLYMVLTRVAGPLANLLMASIVGSIVMIFNAFEYNPRVFLMVVGVNITTAIYNLIPLPPLAAGHLIVALLPPSQDRIRWLLLLAGPYLVLSLALVERLTHHAIFSPYFDPIIRSIYSYIKGN